ncbi:MAG: hypothetical protein HWE10_00255 [Gammaproteobacteria bacterium]|nr:hypothetical protein [Gammaproteobacteria bacterium]
MQQSIKLLFYCHCCVVLMLLITFPISASERELTIWQGINTYHVDRANDEANNEENRITALFYGRWFVGRFINSYSKPSELIGYHFWHVTEESDNWWWHYGASVAAATGYGRNLASNIDGLITIGLSPFAGARFNVSKNVKLGLDTLYLPTDNGGVLVSGVTLTIEL